MIGYVGHTGDTSVNHDIEPQLAAAQQATDKKNLLDDSDSVRPADGDVELEVDGRRHAQTIGRTADQLALATLIGVLAHETGHLAGGHLAKLREQLAQAQTQMIIAMLLGAVAVVALLLARR